MDNLCHSLVGAALARAGLSRRTTLATATLVLAANLPDVDVVAVPLGRDLEWRRGWTHGLLALAVLPLILTGAMLLWDRLRPGTRDRPRPGQLLLLAGLGVATHPLLDFMNNYGVRWLMPFADRWYYGDSLFIIDPWLLLLLSSGIWLGRRWERAGRPDWHRPARLTLALGLVYTGGMIGTTVAARRGVMEADRPSAGGPVRLMVTAVPVDPFRKLVVADRGSNYQVGTWRFLARPSLVWNRMVSKGPVESAPVMAAMEDPAAAGFLHWSRLPVARVIRQSETDAVVRLFDLRYADGESRSWASIDLTVSGSPGSRSAAEPAPRSTGTALAALRSP
jgi:inner membrane protein